jgi:hypothetical protein
VEYGYKLSNGGGGEWRGGFRTEEPVVDADGVSYYTKVEVVAGGGC